MKTSWYTDKAVPDLGPEFEGWTSRKFDEEVFAAHEDIRETKQRFGAATDNEVRLKLMAELQDLEERATWLEDMKHKYHYRLYRKGDRPKRRQPPSPWVWGY